MKVQLAKLKADQEKAGKKIDHKVSTGWMRRGHKRAPETSKVGARRVTC
jgi:hypothetical protein